MLDHHDKHAPYPLLLVHVHGQVVQLGDRISQVFPAVLLCPIVGQREDGHDLPSALPSHHHAENGQDLLLGDHDGCLDGVFFISHHILIYLCTTC